MPIQNLNNLPMGQPEANQPMPQAMPTPGAMPGAMPEGLPSELPVGDPNLELQQALKGDAKLDLQRKFSDVENKEGAYQAERYIAKNKIQELKMGILKNIFDTMLEAGIDPGNRESVGKFLQQLERQDPDLVIMFESALNSLSSDFEKQPAEEEVVEEEASIPPEGLMSKYNNLQQQGLRE